MLKAIITVKIHFWPDDDMFLVKKNGTVWFMKEYNTMNVIQYKNQWVLLNFAPTQIVSPGHI